MSRLYDVVEPAVIDDDMILLAIEEQGPQEEAGRIAKAEGIKHGEVFSLRLDFKNILNVENLWDFTKLTRLQLDNNIIERIGGLEKLVNLEWLDLSFNNIEVLENLNALTKLKDLSLYHNRIGKIENMDALTNLEVLSLGMNQIANLDDVIYLRRFKKLKTLSLTGNPVAEQSEYSLFIIGHLPLLVYLDYRLIKDIQREKAAHSYEIPLTQLAESDQVEDAKRATQEEKQRQLVVHKAAYVENLDGEGLFQSLYEDNPEGQKMNQLPGVQEMLKEFHDQFVEVCKEVFRIGIEEKKKRDAEVEEFMAGLEDAKRQANELGVKAIEEFQAYKEKILPEMVATAEQQNEEAHDRLMEDFNKHKNHLQDTLLDQEMHLADILEDMVREFERNIGDLVSTFIENVQAQFAICRDSVNQNSERLSEVATAIMERFMKGDIDEHEVPEETREILSDKETLENAITSSRELHTVRIDNREDEILSNVRNWMTTLIESMHEEEETKRNRDRVLEVDHLIESIQEEVNQLLDMDIDR